ncbi:hypothetical protein L208DRAFT_1385431 [Tricholoma matsutake]|nr:hypothetical protein L208DRAFT_1385431 [Tricholoma matsutake 945]
MPVYTDGGSVHIHGGYNDVGGDMHYHYSPSTARYENSNNIAYSTIANSFNNHDSSMNKYSRTLPFLIFSLNRFK